MDYKYVKVNGEEDWLPESWRLTTFPVAQGLASGPKDIVGSAFLIQHLESNFIVSAGHVVARAGLTLVFPTKDNKVKKVSIESLEEIGIEWVHHPQRMDIAALYFPPGLSDQIESRAITEKYWTCQPLFKLGAEVKHLGFPDRVSANFGDGTSGPIPVGMPGTIIGFEKNTIQLKTSGAPGASGGPAILRGKEDKPHLIGVITDIRLYGTPTRKQDAVPLNKTAAIPIFTLKEILESEVMIEQINHLRNHAASK